MSTPSRALIVIDVQNEYFDGGLRIDYPDPQVSIENIRKAMDHARAVGIPLIVVQQVAPADYPVFALGSHGYDLHPLVAAVPADCLLQKQLPSCFTGTGLADWLRDRGIDTLVVTGYMTHNCVNSTIVDAVHQGWAVEFLADASGALPYRNSAGTMSGEEAHRVYGVVFQSRFAAVLSTDDWITAVKAGTPPARDNIPASHQRAAG